MNQDRVINLLATGLKAAQVASIVGVTPARISQLSQLPEFQKKLLAKQSELDSSDMEEISLDAKYHLAEISLVNQVIEMAPSAELRDVAGALRIVGERQDRRKIKANPIPVGGSSITLNQVIQLSLPKHAMPEIAFNSAKEVLAIDNRPLAPMSSKGVTNLFQSLDQDKGAQDELRRIPQKTEGLPREAFQEEVRTKQLALFG